MYLWKAIISWIRLLGRIVLSVASSGTWLSYIALDGEDEATWITIPEDLLIPVDDNPVVAIVSITFLDLLNRIQDISYVNTNNV
ncbi:hypothetical protein Tco_1098946 [Tanacetum coccineum]